MSEKIYKKLAGFLDSEMPGEFFGFRAEVYFRQIWETDFVCLRKTPGGKIRKYIFELKEKDFNKVLQQVEVRKQFADYIYIVMVNDSLGHFCYKVGEKFDEIRDEGIGVIYFHDKEFHRVVNPKFQNNPVPDHDTHGKGWRDFYPDIFC